MSILSLLGDHVAATTSVRRILAWEGGSPLPGGVVVKQRRVSAVVESPSDARSPEPLSWVRRGKSVRLSSVSPRCKSCFTSPAVSPGQQRPALSYCLLALQRSSRWRQPASQPVSQPSCMTVTGPATTAADALGLYTTSVSCASCFAMLQPNKRRRKTNRISNDSLHKWVQ